MNRFGFVTLLLVVVAIGNPRACASAEPKEKDKDLVKLTKSAAAQIKKVVRDQDLDADTVLRVGVIQSGKAGFRYELGFDKKSAKTKKDLEVESFGVRILVDKASSPFLKGTTIDFEEKPEPGFRFNNPNAVKVDESTR